MKVSFENLGVVKRADIDLSKKLLVFCGPNGTGKTYVSYAVYGYLENQIYYQMFSFTMLFGKRELKISIDYDQLYHLMKKYGSSSFINDIFGLKNEFVFSEFQVKSCPSKEEFIKKVKGNSFKFDYTYLGITVIYEKESGSDQILLKLASSIDKVSNPDKVGTSHNLHLTKYLCLQSIVSSYILPVERSSAYTFANELARNRFTEEKSYRYPRPIQDALATAIDLNYIKTKESKYRWLAEEIEELILHGTVDVSTDGEMQFKPEKSEKSLSIHLSASIIKNLSGLLIYLKHQAKDNELLIIDEPELGLHPDNQILLARIFARLINNNIRLLISTHSDYIIRELNNLIMLSSDKSGIRQNLVKWGYKEDERIKPGDVGAYLFDFDKEENSRVIVKSLDVDEKGFEVDTIDRAINLLNENSENIFYTLKYGKED